MKKDMATNVLITKLQAVPRERAQLILTKVALELHAKGHCSTWHCTGHSKTSGHGNS